MQPEWKTCLREGVDRLALNQWVGERQLDLLLTYLQWLHKWNRAYNLTSVRDPLDMIAVHLLDSLALLPYLQGKRFIDVGTGPGLPGIPLAIAKPESSFHLLDSNGKRVRFMFQVKTALGLQNVAEMQKRVEYFQPVERYDGVLSRAFTALPNMVDCCAHLLKKEGYFFAMKGKVPQQEIESLPKSVEVTNVYPLSIPGVDGERHLVILRNSQQRDNP